MKNEKILCPYCREDVPMEMAMSGTHMRCPRCHSTSPLIRDLHTAALTPEDVVRHAAMSRHREAVKDGDLISRAATIRGFLAEHPYGYRFGDFIEYFKAAPAVDSEPVRHGRWIPQDNTFTRYMCSECETRNHDYPTNYCPNCGAKMDGGAQNVNANG